MDGSEAGSAARRVRRRRKRPAAAPEVPAGPSPASVPRQTEPSVPPRAGRGRDHTHEARETERGLRALVGAGPSQIDTVVAMRVRDAARPTAADLAEAERDTVVVHRNWTPPA